ncbi:cell division protein ZapB [Mycobacterium szulgai]|uniref:cell division protein ZapB n=1 Tax=Mycobacterium szulgai TaxID=1787 RepID=UPI0021F3A1CA|nr:hypothetical protein [Mycobacterium szulgai]MCV7076031.1 cell division protein ZapB [Mycobacterium szulgai]
MAEHDDDDLASQLRLSTVEVITLHALRLQMMQHDVERERRQKVRERKQDVIRQFHDEFRQLLVANGDEMPHVDLSSAGVAADLAHAVDRRSRAMILLIELMTFNPWFPSLGWVSAARKEALKSAVGQLSGVSQDDFDAATTEFDGLIKQLRRKSIRWGRVAAASVVGLVVGAATAGWAAPLVGGAIGASMGFYGAAATSAGLAVLGGGSLAAGGFGVLGGTILVSGVGGVFAAGAAGAAARFTRIGAAAVVADAIKLDLLARLVLADSKDRDQKLRRVAEGLQNRINEFSEKINSLSERIASLKADNKRLSAENSSLKEELAKLREDRAEAHNTRAILEVVLDRLPAIAS